MKKNYNNPNGIMEILYYNDTVSIIYEACTACYNNTKDISYEEKKEYISKRVKCGHESVLEHGYVSLIISGITTEDFTRCLAEITGPGHYLHIHSSCLEDESYSLLIGGSVRAFKHCITEYLNSFNNEVNNFIINHILNALYETTVKEFYPELEEFHKYFMDKIFDPIDIYKDIEESFNDNKIENDLFTIYGIIPYSYIYKIQNVILRNGFLLDELHHVIPLTVCFKNMSRTATHQLVRHRNAITQESQRYVDYSNAGFTIPDMSSYMEDYEEKKFKIELSKFGMKAEMPLSGLVETLLDIYPQLIEQGMKKEDARAFLPSNVQCGRLYMTFTYKTFEKFLELRTDPHAQTEIRKYAISLQDVFDGFYYENN